MGSKRVIEELLRGRDLAKQLKSVINNGCDEKLAATTTTTPFAEHLVKEVLMSFSNSLLFLNNPTSQSHDINPSNSEDSQESNCKTSTLKEKRGCYKRRRTSQSLEKESETPIEDGHQWRKYGQKVILNTKYPRNYYRCTHKFDQSCQATKQVQRIQDDPPLHRTTYYGNHTCRNMLNPEIILDPIASSGPSVFLSFDNTLPNPAKQDCPFLSSSFPSSSSTSSSVKKECKDEINPPSSSSNDYFLPSEFTFDNSPSHVISDVLCDPAEFDQAFEPFLAFR
ncbi:WRKY DNA-binding transcription factor 70-like [Gastrolobium bilobum]|uniref:WRKY DNA-binding transcription factor 70-like n=1 Tax=Gastrolobium bilobum TaxID=150636 RepID=UPI002AB2F7FF|nr:WRKY DNA-binding transcription factor 70-like [Gastrolobium bilobum]